MTGMAVLLLVRPIVRHRDRFAQRDERGDIWRRDPRYAIRTCCHYSGTKVTAHYAAAQVYLGGTCLRRPEQPARRRPPNHEYRQEAALQLVERGLVVASDRTDRFALTCLQGEILHDFGAMADAGRAYPIRRANSLSNGSPDRGSQVRTRLPAGGKWIRTLGPARTGDGFEPALVPPQSNIRNPARRRRNSSTWLPVNVGLLVCWREVANGQVVDHASTQRRHLSHHRISCVMIGSGQPRSSQTGASAEPQATLTAA